jgi:hypothetical protein
MNRFRYPKGYCPIPHEACVRGGKNSEHSHKTENGHAAGGRATGAKNFSREDSKTGGKKSAHIRSHIRFATYQKDCPWCIKLIDIPS